MSPSDIYSLAGLVAVLLSAAIVVYASFKTNSSKVWREEAEAYKAKSDRLEENLTEIKERLRRIEQDNDRLIQLLTSLDPNQLVTLRTLYHPPEV